MIKIKIKPKEQGKPDSPIVKTIKVFGLKIYEKTLYPQKRFYTEEDHYEFYIKK